MKIVQPGRRTAKRAMDWYRIRTSGYRGAEGLIIVLGDSHTRGTGASAPSNRYVAVLERHLKQPVFGVGEGGNGVLSGSANWPRRDLGTCVGQAVYLRPSRMVVVMSMNDRFWEDATIEVAQVRLIHRLPMTPTVIGPLLHTEDTDELDRMRAISRRTAERLGLLYIDPAGWVDDDPQFLAADGAHLNDKGHAVVGTQLATRLVTRG